tara:strand:+ start:54 stop:578 length:525 start_codon:yes stop_codon:yes gene_type:complete
VNNKPKILYEKYKELVFNVALHYTQNLEDAEEITQDVFISIFENIKDFREESTLKTWAYRITINKSLDFLKSKKRLKRIFFFKSLKIDDQEKKISIPEINHPGVILENKESVNAIFNCINKLPPKLKTVIILLKIEEKSQKETAKIMQLSVKAIESLFHRAKKKLSIILKDNER